MTKARVRDVKDDPKMPIKAVVGAVVAVAAWVVSSNITDNAFVVGVCTVIATFGGTYLAPNPKVRK